MPEEILKNHLEIQRLLRSRNSRSMTEEEFREQCRSYIVGNAFDVFTDPDVINRQMLDEIALSRLQVAG